MAYIGRSDLRMVTYMSRKYKYYNVQFKYFDDYILWLFEEYCNFDEDKYYKQFEEDVEEYCNFQTGKQREKEGLIHVKKV